MGEDHQQRGPGLYTLREASALTGLTPEALRLRLKRGKLEAELGNDGHPRVRLTTADLETSGQQKPTAQECGALLDKQKPTAEGLKALLDQQEPTKQDALGQPLPVLALVDRLLARVDGATETAAAARERAAKAEGELSALREALTRAEARARAAEREASLLRARGFWARLRNWQ